MTFYTHSTALHFKSCFCLLVVLLFKEVLVKQTSLCWRNLLGEEIHSSYICLADTYTSLKKIIF